MKLLFVRSLLLRDRSRQHGYLFLVAEVQHDSGHRFTLPTQTWRAEH